MVKKKRKSYDYPEPDWLRVFANIKVLTGLPLKETKKGWEGNCYLNGQPNPRQDKLVVSLINGNILFLEQGGEVINLPTWLMRFGGASSFKHAMDMIKGHDTPHISPPTIEYTEKDINYVKSEILAQEKANSDHSRSNLFRWLCSMFHESDVRRIFDRYNVTTSWRGDTCFWYVDSEGRICRDKTMKYLPNGKRDRDSKFSTYTKYKQKDGFTGRCVFGEHLVRPESKVKCCESEKTSIIMALHQPDIVWVATGGKGKVTLAKPTWLLYPDKDAIEEWSQYGQVVDWWSGWDEIQANSDIGDRIVSEITKGG